MRRVILIGAIVVGLLAAGAALLSGAAVALLAGFGGAMPGGALTLNTLTLALVVLGGGLGLTVAWHGWRAVTGRASRTCGMPAWGWWLLALVGVLVGGQLFVSAGLTAVLPVFHLLAAVIPPLLFLSLALGGARRAGQAMTTRAVTSSIAWGGLGGVVLALFTELVLILGLLLLLPPLIDLISPGFMTELQDVFAYMQQTGKINLRALQPYLNSPWLLLGGLLLGSVLVPLIEEAAKALAVPLLLLTGRRVTRVEAFLLGVAAGAGFAMVEGVTNGALALAEPASWATAMAARAGAAALHCVVSGLAGLGWHAILVERKWLRGLGPGLAAVVYHGLWNAGALGAAWLSLQRGGSGLSGVGNLLSLPIIALLGGLFFVGLGWLRWLPARLREPVSTPVAAIIAPYETPGEGAAYRSYAREEDDDG